jgi:hypothetical protein
MYVKHSTRKHAHIHVSVNTATWCAGFVHASAGAEYSFATPLAGSWSERVKLWVDNEMLIDQWTSLDHHTPGAHWKSREEAEYYSLEMEYTCSTTDLTSLAGCGYSLEWMPFSTGTFEWAVVPAANLAIKKPAMCRDSEFLPDISVAGSCKQLSDTEFQCPSGCEYVKHERHWSCECQVTWIEECAQKLPGEGGRISYAACSLQCSVVVGGGETTRWSVFLLSRSQKPLRIVARMHTEKWAARTRMRRRPLSYRFHADL